MAVTTLKGQAALADTHWLVPYYASVYTSGMLNANGGDGTGGAAVLAG